MLFWRPTVEANAAAVLELVAGQVAHREEAGADHPRPAQVGDEAGESAIGDERRHVEQHFPRFASALFTSRNL